MTLQIYQVSAQSLDIPLIINNIQETYKEATIKRVYSLEGLGQLWEETNNLQLFNIIVNDQTGPSSNNKQTKKQIIIIQDINFTENTLKILNNLNTNKVLAIFLVNCKLPKQQKIIKTQALPNTLKQKKNINYARAVLSKYLSQTEIQEILPALLLQNSDYYINTQELNKLIKLLSLPGISKRDIIKNFVQQSHNIFKLTDIFLNGNLETTTKYIETYLKLEDIHSLINILKNNLQIIYLLKQTSTTDVAKKLKKSHYYIQQLSRSAQKYTQHQIYKILMLILEFEINIRKGKYENPNKQFLLFLLKIKSLLKP